MKLFLDITIYFFSILGGLISIWTIYKWLVKDYLGKSAKGSTLLKR